MFVVYHIQSTMLVGPTKHGNPHTSYARTYKTAHMAARTCAKFNDKAGKVEYASCHADDYQKNVVYMVERKNLLSGKTYMEPSNTPGYCSPSSEAYWSS